MKPQNVKKLSLFFCSGLLLILHNICQGQTDIPKDYKLLYEENFESVADLSGFHTTDPKAWRISQDPSGKSLEIHGSSEYSPPFRSPFNIAMISGKKFGSFILEADLQQTGKEYGHRDLCLFFGMKDAAHFYYVHLASQADPNAHNIFLVNGAPRTNIAQQVTEGIDWGTTEDWHKVRLERNIETGSIKVFFDNMDEPIMMAEDKHFDLGYIGFGTFDDSGKFDNIKIWGQPEQFQESEGKSIF